MHGGLSKSWSLFGSPKLGPVLGLYYNRDPKRDHNFDNPPHKQLSVGLFVVSQLKLLVQLFCHCSVVCFCWVGGWAGARGSALVSFAKVGFAVPKP